MDSIKINIHGIYDQRTLKFLKSIGTATFGFDFNPRSFNFIQEHLFLDLLRNYISENEVIYLCFSSNSDYMINKLIEDIKEIRPNFNNIFFVFDVVNEDILSFSYKYILKYNPSLSNEYINSNFFNGLVIDFNYLDQALNLGKLNNFCTNLMSRYPKIVSRNLPLILNLNWDDNVFTSIFEFLDFQQIQFNLNNEIEICYRNIDQEKLKKEINLKRKFLNI